MHISFILLWAILVYLVIGFIGGVEVSLHGDNQSEKVIGIISLVFTTTLICAFLASR